MNEGQQVQDVTPQDLAILHADRYGKTAEGRLHFVDAAMQRFHLPPAELERIFNEATETVNGGD